MKTLIHIIVLSGAVGLAVAGSAGCDSGSSTPKGTGGAGGKVGVGGSGVGGSGVGGSVGGSGVGGSTDGGGAGGTAVGGSSSIGGAGGTTGVGGAGGSLTPTQIHTMIINAPGVGDVPLSITATPVAYPACN